MLGGGGKKRTNFLKLFILNICVVKYFFVPLPVILIYCSTMLLENISLAPIFNYVRLHENGETQTT